MHRGQVQRQVGIGALVLTIRSAGPGAHRVDGAQVACVGGHAAGHGAGAGVEIRSSAVKGVPSCHFTPSRSLNSQVLSSRLPADGQAGLQLVPLVLDQQVPECRATERSPAWLFSCGSSEDSGSAKPMDSLSAEAAADAPRGCGQVEGSGVSCSGSLVRGTAGLAPCQPLRVHVVQMTGGMVVDGDSLQCGNLSRAASHAGSADGNGSRRAG